MSVSTAALLNRSGIRNAGRAASIVGRIQDIGLMLSIGFVRVRCRAVDSIRTTNRPSMTRKESSAAGTST